MCFFFWVIYIFPSSFSLFWLVTCLIQCCCASDLAKGSKQVNVQVSKTKQKKRFGKLHAVTTNT